MDGQTIVPRIPFLTAVGDTGTSKQMKQLTLLLTLLFVYSLGFSQINIDPPAIEDRSLALKSAQGNFVAGYLFTVAAIGFGNAEMFMKTDKGYSNYNGFFAAGSGFIAAVFFLGAYEDYREYKGLGKKNRQKLSLAPSGNGLSVRYSF